MRRLFVAGAAQADIEDILEFSRATHGAEAARRYLVLIHQGIADVWREPGRPTCTTDEPGGLRHYPLRLAARRLARADNVRSAPHLIVYRYDEAMVEIVRLLHAAMDLPRHLAEFGEG